MATRATTVQITMPQMGESVTEGTVLEWLKQVGDHVDADEPLVEISTDKVDAEVPAPAAGTLVKILAEPDSTVEVGAVLGEIETGGDGSDGAAPAAEAPPAETPAAEAPGAEAPAAEPVSSETPAEAPATPEMSPADAETAELVDVAFPEMGDSVAEGTVLEWRVKPGDTVAVDDPLVEISTDKVDAEVPSPVGGTIQEILVGADETVAVGSILCRIAAGAAAAPSPAADGPPQPAAEVTDARPAAPSGNGGNATPVAARIASDLGIDLSTVAGTGPRGRVTKEDVLAAAEGNGAPQAATEPAAPAPAAGPEAKPIRGPAATLVKFMNDSRSIPTATSFRTLPVDVLDARRKELKAGGRKLSFTHLIAWAIVQAARDMPVMGHAYSEQDGKPQRVTPATVSLGLAV
ncbi:MAG: biotin/lipoyl-containing protein, partial [Thermoleophilaceae bacterium]